MKLFRTKSSVLLLLSLFTYLGMVVSIPFMKVVNERSRIWEDYYMLLVKGENDTTDRLETALSRQGFSFISAENTTVPFFDYSGIKPVPLNDIQTRYLSFDPRISDYARNVSSYFMSSTGGKDCRIIYVKSDDSPLRFALEIEGLSEWSSEGVSIADFNWTGMVITLVIFLVLVAFFVSWTELPKVIPILIAVPWIEFLVLGADFGAVGPILLYGAIMTSFEYIKPSFLERQQGGARLQALPVWIGSMLVLSLVVSLAMTAGVSGWGYTLRVFGYGILGSCLIAAAYGALTHMTTERMEHDRFIPVPIIAGTVHAERTRDRRRIGILAALVLSSYILPGIPESDTGYPVPVPVRYKHAPDFSWDSLAVLSERKDNTGSLPDLSDYLTHMAYQEGFLYNRDYTFPERNETIQVNRFVRKSGEIFSRSDCVKQFTDTWYEDIMANASKDGITALLLAQEYPTGVVTCKIKKRTLVPSNAREQLLVGLIALSPFTVQDVVSRGLVQYTAKDVK